jgi:hypothetical protein
MMPVSDALLFLICYESKTGRKRPYIRAIFVDQKNP